MANDESRTACRPSAGLGPIVFFNPTGISFPGEALSAVPVRTNLSDITSARLCASHAQNLALRYSARFAQLKGESCLEKLATQ